MMNNTTGNDKKTYFASIDVARTFGIFLVVLGHAFPDASLQGGIQNEMWRLVFNIIYSFHMPLFIFLSGFVLDKYSIDVQDCWNRTLKKFKRLMVPYFCWGILYIPFRILLAQYASAEFSIARIWRIMIGENPYSGLWFLYALFLISLTYIWLVKSDKGLRFAFIISILMLFIGKYLYIIEPVNWLFLYLFYYLLGVYFRKYYSLIYGKVIKPKYVLISGILFASSFFLNYQYQTSMSGLISIVTAISGIIVVCIISEKLSENVFLAQLGKYGMDIFIISGPILVFLRIVLYNFLGIRYTPYVIFATIFAYTVPILVSKFIVRKNRLLSGLFLGMWK